MRPATLKALKGSIKKWEGIVAGKVADHGDENCPLCKRFVVDNGWPFRSCTRADGEQCPVYLASGEPGCGGSPYEDWNQALIYRYRQYRRTVNDDETVMCAVLELEFLKSLLPRKRK